ncbi:unnamed protein product [Brugia pahangi]|uniref:52 kDa repressor of the inhibitor of the protein kinase-like n=1 Tax=Brugia pahangi TaxID=6280 RepID=A0A0N4TM96_BRUPA|nr:unnamed protein product [Brugia pahangi]
MIPDDDLPLASILGLGYNFARSVRLRINHMATKKCRQVQSSLAYAIKINPNVDTALQIFKRIVSLINNISSHLSTISQVTYQQYLKSLINNISSHLSAIAKSFLQFMVASDLSVSLSIVSRRENCERVSNMQDGYNLLLSDKMFGQTIDKEIKRFGKAAE